MRLFVGIPISSVLAAELSQIVSSLQTAEDGLRWSASASWHITLQFLGQTRAEQYGCVVEQLQQVTSQPVPVRPAALGFFDRAGVFFAGVDRTPGLLSLQQAVNERLSHCGFVPETRPYHPHITLARSKSKGSARMREMHALDLRVRRLQTLTPFVCGEFVLYESVAAPGGSRYEIRERFPLAQLE